MVRTSFILKWDEPILKGLSDADRLRYWHIVADLALKRKDLELSQGLNKDGNPLPSVKDRKRRRSAMTPDGKGDPNAPYLMPGGPLSRTRSLLAAKARKDGVVMWWRFDAFTGGEWGRVIRYHSLRGKAYDVIGLSPAGVQAVRAEANRKFKEGRSPTLPAPRSGARIPTPQVGRKNLELADLFDPERVDEVRKAISEGRSSGFLTQAEWAKYWRSGRTTGTLARPSQTSPSVRAGSSNQLLKHVWEVKTPGNPSWFARVKNFFRAAFGGEQGV